jgi:zinc transporter, ZIP family
VAVGLRLPPRVAATVTAFAGGVLLAAVAVELVPEADELAGRWLTAAGLAAGMVLYVGADAWLTRDERMREARRSVHAAMVGQPMPRSAATADSAPRGRPQAARGESIAAGIFVDGMPESIALGLTMAGGQVGVALLAGVLVGNLVESYGAAQPIIAAGRSRRFAVGLLAAIGAAVAGTTVLGGTVLADASPALIGSAQALASGAVLLVIGLLSCCRSRPPARAGRCSAGRPVPVAAARRRTCPVRPAGHGPGAAGRTGRRRAGRAGRPVRR